MAAILDVVAILEKIQKIGKNNKGLPHQLFFFNLDDQLIYFFT